MVDPRGGSLSHEQGTPVMTALFLLLLALSPGKAVDTFQMIYQFECLMGQNIDVIQWF